ncbi:MAG: lysophospholipid acyltransferase family protein [Pseudomonadota bacterium]|nr:lysophospholipid acyltransferase family protein [Pseudomonadota bacterium]
MKSKSSFSHIVQYSLMRVFLGICYILPWRLLYCLAKPAAQLFQYLTKKKLSFIDENLARCFPDKSKEEIAHLKRKSYLQVLTVNLEFMKFFTLSTKRQQQILSSHIRIKSPELIQNLLDKNQSCILITAHFGNWEWLNAKLSRQFQGNYSSAYKTLKNPLVESYFWKLRMDSMHVGSKLGDKHKFVKNYFKDLRMQEKGEAQAKVYFMASDQKPEKSQEKIRLTFLGRQTDFILGPEKLARQKQLPMLYIKMLRTKAGYYTVTFTKIAYDQTKPLGEATKKYAELLEAQIQEQPESWLWCYNRWKGMKEVE